MLRVELVKQLADTFRKGGTVELNHKGELELRTATLAQRLLGPSQKVKIAPNALSKVSELVANAKPSTPEGEQDLDEVSTELAMAYFGHSHHHPWALLLKKGPMNFPLSPQTPLQSPIETTLSSQSKRADPRLHAQCAKLFVELVQQALREGAQGHCHIEHQLLLLAQLPVNSTPARLKISMKQLEFSMIFSEKSAK